MNKLFLTLAMALGLTLAAPVAFARDHHGGGHHNGHHHGGGHYNGGHHHGGGSWNHHRPGSGFDIYIGPNYRRPPFPFPNPYPYPNPRPRPYPNTPAPITVLVTEYCYGEIYTHFVTAYWDRYYGGWWYYDCTGRYRRAR